MKFYEVTSQFVLTGHVVGYDVMVITTKLWDAMSPEQRAKFQAAAEKAIDEYTTKYNALEKEAIEFFKSQGKKIYTPNLEAFRSFAQKKYADKYGADWPKGTLERINAIQ
jgi:TRAP-type C4-dicarboxylate transport system substrate-binding protein